MASILICWVSMAYDSDGTPAASFKPLAFGKHKGSTGSSGLCFSTCFFGSDPAPALGSNGEQRACRGRPKRAPLAWCRTKQLAQRDDGGGRARAAWMTRRMGAAELRSVASRGGC